MSYSFTNSDIESIAKFLNTDFRDFGNVWSWKVENPTNKQALVVSLYNEAIIDGKSTGTLLSVQTLHGYFELHDVDGYLILEPDEIIFYQMTETKVSSLIIGHQATCSSYSNISREILKSDFTTLDPAVLLSAMQLSLLENVINL